MELYYQPRRRKGEVIEVDLPKHEPRGREKQIAEHLKEPLHPLSPIEIEARMQRAEKRKRAFDNDKILRALRYNLRSAEVMRHHKEEESLKHYDQLNKLQRDMMIHLENHDKYLRNRVTKNHEHVQHCLQIGTRIKALRAAQRYQQQYPGRSFVQQQPIFVQPPPQQRIIYN
eukprot:GEZU01036497.1.p1 GENE.GEZU01036497.1~~GEZU01036497.1.p1  ORF type:complete len:184 (+),score=39.80 GEZU01036497.1:39-554(+)